MKKANKLFSLTLAMIMIIGLVPIKSMIVFADPGDWGEPLGEMQYLLATYNALPNAEGNVYELYDGIKPVKIYNTSDSEELLKACSFYKSGTALSSSYSGKNMTEFALSVGAKLGYSVNADLGIDKLFSIGATRKFNLSGDFAYNKSTETYFYEFEAIRTEGTYTFNENKLEYLKKHLDPDFEKALYGLTYADPISFFNKYGTHFIGSYTMGGKAGTYTSTVSLDEKTGGGLEAAYASGTGGSDQESGIKAGFGKALDISGKITASYNSGEYRSISKTYSYGGNSIIDNNTDASKISAAYTDWANSFIITGQGWNCNVIADKNLVMYPIWELLPEGERRTELYNAYMEKSLKQDVSFFEKYVYNMPENDLPDYSGYEIISDATQFDNIRSGLHLKYVLACNIDLGSREWEPIGTEEKPFTGILDGNGNTVSGLKITECKNGTAGLFGYNSGTVKNLTVSGTINVDANGSNDLAVLGGIAGVNAGTIVGCRSNVKINGRMIASTEQMSSTAGSTTWFEENGEAIASAKQTASITVSDGMLYESFPLKLTGTAKDLVIAVPDSSSPAFLILENADLSGQILMTGGNSRTLCIVSIGTENKFTGTNDEIAITAHDSKLYLTGDAPLTICGGDGSDGYNGTGYKQNGVHGADGSDGQDGCHAISAKEIYAEIDSLTIAGGNGGKGGNGAPGRNGANGTDGKHETAEATDGGAGGNGGKGGHGGNGAYPIAGLLYVHGNSDVRLVIGCANGGGDGGNGGNGGAGGNGDTYDYDGWTIGWANDVGYRGGDGGTAGSGGNGGASGTCPEITAEQIAGIKCFDQSKALLYHSDDILNTSGNGGKRGAVGKGGAGGKRRAKTVLGGWADYEYFDAGKTPSNTAIAGKDASPFEFDPWHPASAAITVNKQYHLYSGKTKTALEAREDAKNHGETLVAVGSANEQETLSTLITTVSGADFWIGLTRNRTKGYNVFDWADGSTIKVTENTFGKRAEVVRIDQNGKTVCEAYSYFADGEPNDLRSNENDVYLSQNGWYDADALTTADGYITEINLLAESSNTLKCNTVAAGGICGRNVGTVSTSDSIGAVTVNGLSEMYGVSAIACGICGINDGLIENCYNSGTIESTARTNSSDFFADAYAKNVTVNENGTVVNSGGAVDPVADAISGNELCNVITDLEGSDCFAETTAKELTADERDAQTISVEQVLKTEYMSGDIFNKNDLVLTVAGGTAADCRIYCVLSQPGNTVAVVKNTECTRYVPLKVLPTVPITLSVLQQPKVSYVQNETFTSDGLILELTYNNGVAMRLLPTSDGVTVSKPDMTKTGSQTVIITYSFNGGLDKLTTSYEIEVSAGALSGIQIDCLPEKRTYSVGETLNTKGLVLSKRYNDGSSAPLPLDDADLQFLYDFSTAGEKTVTILYCNEYEATFTVQVEQATFVLGDADGDGEVSDWDAILFERYLAGWEIEEIMLDAMDIDGDGELSDWDAILLERYLAGWDISF